MRVGRLPSRAGLPPPRDHVVSTAEARALKARRATEARLSQVAVVDARMVATERAARRARAHTFPLGAPWMQRLSVARPHDLLCTCGGVNCPPF